MISQEQDLVLISEYQPGKDSLMDSLIVVGKSLLRMELMDFIKALVYLWSVFLLTELFISGNYLFIQVAMMLVKDLFGEIKNKRENIPHINL